MIRVVADENIGFIPALLAGQAEVIQLPGRSIQREHLREADALLVRAVTTVDEALISGSKVKFVGTTTSGFDHVDRRWLEDQGITFAYAPGSNANSVAEYVVAALLELAHRYGETLQDKTMAIIGAGHVGAQVAGKARVLGLRVLLNDPPLFDATQDGRYLPLPEALQDADIVSLHVPLTIDGPYPTHGLVNESFIGMMNSGAWFVNAARGPVVDEAALKPALISGKIRAAVLDVWDGEPVPDQDLIRQAAIATPHIAGYSYNGKIKAVRAVASALAIQFAIEPNWKLLDEALPRLSLDIPKQSDNQNSDEAVHGLIKSGVYDIMTDDQKFREAALQGTAEDRGAKFDAIRKNYPRRYEFPTYTIQENMTSPMGPLLQALGFRFQRVS